MNNDEQKEIIKELIEKSKVKIFFSKNEKILATAQVIIGDLIEINGFTIKNSRYEETPLWIQPPTYSPPKYLNAFYLKDEKVFKHLIDKIEREYLNKKEKEEIDTSLDDIDF